MTLTTETPADMGNISPAPGNATTIAVSYLRVSTKEQATKGDSGEGFSIPAQRDANAKKAADLGARIVKEFVDAGESARSADRDELQAMLVYIKDHKVDHVIVHKVDRLARNRTDDVRILEALAAAGVTLISATEAIDQTPSGMLLHGIMSSIAEFYSQNLATEVKKGMSQKLAQGGTPTRAPIGYKNVRVIDANGREQRTVEVDPDRGPRIAWAFQRYAQGDISVVALLEELTARGLTSLPTPRYPERPVSKNTMHHILANPYYAGTIRYKGALHPGSHEPLITQELFEKVQTVLASRNANHTRQTTHNHFLKGMLWCSCGARMVQDFATNRYKNTYAYYVCTGAKKKSGCTRRGVPVPVAERLVARTFASLTLSAVQVKEVQRLTYAAFDRHAVESGAELANLTGHRAKLEAESEKLITAHFADAIDLPTLKRHQDRIRAGLADIDHRLAEHDGQHADARNYLDTALSLLTEPAKMYAASSDHGKRLANQAFYERIVITDDESAAVPALAEPFEAIQDTLNPGNDDGDSVGIPPGSTTHVAGSNKQPEVRLKGLEPPTF